jgi:hypothetical protein
MITNFQRGAAMLALACSAFGIGCKTNPSESVRGILAPVTKSDRIEKFDLIESNGRLFYHVISPDQEWYVPVSQDEAGISDIILSESSVSNLMAVTEQARVAENPRRLFLLRDGRLYVHSMFFQMDEDWPPIVPQYIYRVEKISNTGVHLFRVERVVPWSRVSFSRAEEYDGSVRTASQ